MSDPYQISTSICRYRKSSVFCLSEAYQTTQNLTPLHFKPPLLTPLIHKINYAVHKHRVLYAVVCWCRVPFPLAKPSRSFKNLTKTPPGKKCSNHPFDFSKRRKKPQKIENRLTNKTFTPQNDLDYEFSIVKMLARDVTICFSRKKIMFLLSFLYILNAATPANTYV